MCVWVCVGVLVCSFLSQFQNIYLYTYLYLVWSIYLSINLSSLCISNLYNSRIDLCVCVSAQMYQLISHSFPFSLFQQVFWVFFFLFFYLQTFVKIRLSLHSLFFYIQPVTNACCLLRPEVSLKIWVIAFQIFFFLFHFLFLSFSFFFSVWTYV